MIFQNFRSNTYCIGGKHRPATENPFGEKTFNKKTGKDIKLLAGQCSICNKKNQSLRAIIR